MSKTPRMDSAFKQLTSTTPRMNWQLDQCYREGCKLEREVAEAKEQCSNLDDQVSAAMMVIRGLERERDRMAEALRELCETLLNDKPRDITELLNKAGDALAAVKGGSDE